MILHQCTKNYDHMTYSCRVMARDGWTDRNQARQTDRRSEKVTCKGIY